MAEQVDASNTYHALTEIQRERSNSSIIYGILENDRGNHYNSAVIIPAKGLIEVYRQKLPATIAGAPVLPIQRGEYRAIHVGPILGGHQWKVGLMICSDHFGAESFFNHYSEGKTDAVLLIADSISREWLDKFPPLCRQHALPAIVCNAGGPVGGDKGRSCVIDAQGEIVAQLPEFATSAAIDLNWH